MRRVVEMSALTKTTAAPSDLKPTLLRPLPLRKYLPLMSSVLPTAARIGVTEVTTGALDLDVAASAWPAGTRSAASVAVMATRRSCDVRRRVSIRERHRLAGWTA